MPLVFDYCDTSGVGNLVRSAYSTHVFLYRPLCPQQLFGTPEIRPERIVDSFNQLPLPVITGEHVTDHFTLPSADVAH